MDMTLPRRGARPHNQPASTQENILDFEVLFQEHWERLCAVLRRLVDDPAEAEDLALEAFLQLHQHPPAYSSNLAGWLYRVGMNLGLNALRAHKRRQQYETQAGQLHLLENPGNDPATALENSQERQRVRTTLENMKPRAAQILILRHSGCSYQEIAAALNVSPASVGALLARAEKEFEKLYARS